MDGNKEWMMTGKIGCTFAAMLARDPENVGWVTITNPDKMYVPSHACLLSMQFPGKSMRQVFDWAEENGMYFEQTGDGCRGLRANVNGHVSWVQYFGPDAQVKTRQAPIPELMMCVRLPATWYVKVGFKGILHLAHASVEYIRESARDLLWASSFKNTEKRLGHKPTVREAAKTTYHE